MNFRGLSSCIPVIAGAVAALAVMAPATALAAKPAFQMPFPCGQTWDSNTYTSHNPQLATDLNRGAPWDDEGDTVVASAGGTVSTSTFSTSSGYGNYIVINHGGGWSTLYAHLKTRAVNAGQRVSAGQRIGQVGHTSAKYNLIPHLHYEQKYNGALQRIVWNGSQIRYWGHANYTSRNACGGSGGHAGTVNTTNGGPLNVRSGPSTSYSIVGSRADGASVTIYCQKVGQSITGTYGTSKLWNKISKTSAQYIPDAYTYTGSDGRVAPDC